MPDSLTAMLGALVEENQVVYSNQLFEGLYNKISPRPCVHLFFLHRSSLINLKDTSHRLVLYVPRLPH